MPQLDDRKEHHSELADGVSARRGFGKRADDT
jgi:hypothetical protein